MGDVDKWLEITKDCKYLPENDFRKLCEIVSNILAEEPNIQNVSTPVTVCGDIHGQYYDLRKLFEIGGQIPHTNYIFMGDFVDRGHHSLETITKLLTLKAKYPNKITLIRGNHESRQITRTYGFYDECLNKYGNENPWKICCKVFDLMNIGAIVDNEVLCVHGGLSPDGTMIDEFQTIQRNQEIPCIGLFSDIVWSDPDDHDDFNVSPRGAGWLFGPNVTEQFMYLNGLTLICRAHQLVNEGYKYHFNGKLITVWSAPNYCYRCANVAAILQLHTPQQRNLEVFDCVPDSERTFPSLLRSRQAYFL